MLSCLACDQNLQHALLDYNATIAYNSQYADTETATNQKLILQDNMIDMALAVKAQKLPILQVWIWLDWSKNEAHALITG